MTDILKQIQTDLLDSKVPLSTVLRKAKVLAHQLRSKELNDWVSQELDGYKSDVELPDYRVLQTACVGAWTNGFWMVKNLVVPIHNIEEKWLKERLTRHPVWEGVRSVEQMVENKELKYVLIPELTRLVNYYVNENGYSFAEIKILVGAHQFEQILDTVRNRLLDFVLELSETWNVRGALPPEAELSNLVSVFIYNNPQGGKVSVFDQRGQQVVYQYNAAGNINIEAVQNKNDLVEELDKLRLEVERAKEAETIDQDVAVEAEYHILQASKEAGKENPDKGSFSKHIGKAKALLGDAAAAAGLVTALLKAVEVADKIF